MYTFHFSLMPISLPTDFLLPLYSFIEKSKKNRKRKRKEKKVERSKLTSIAYDLCLLNNINILSMCYCCCCHRFFLYEKLSILPSIIIRAGRSEREMKMMVYGKNGNLCGNTIWVLVVTLMQPSAVAMSLR